MDRNRPYPETGQNPKSGKGKESERIQEYRPSQGRKRIAELNIEIYNRLHRNFFSLL